MIDVVKLEEELENDIETILRYLDKHGQVIFQDNLQVLGFDNSLSFNYFALGIREVLRNILESNKINEKIKECQWYRKYGYDEQCTSGATTRQRLAYIICQNNDIDSVDKLINIKEIIEQLCKEYKELSKFAHMKNRPSDSVWENKAKKLIKEFAKFIIKIDKFQRKFLSFFEEIHEYVDIYFTTEEPNEFLAMATHCYEIDTNICDIVITDFNERDDIILRVEAEGKISSTLQWGSDNDYRHGDGLAERHTYPIKVDLDISFNKLNKKIIDIQIKNYDIDNSSFYE